MHIRDRIKELRRVPASELRPNPRNWRMHPPGQAQALAAVLAEIGWADVVLARETPGGLELIDGHLRAETAGGQLVPVLVLDVDEREADKLLATLDPLAAMATVDAGKLDELLARVHVDDDAMGAMLADLKDSVSASSGAANSGAQRAVELKETWSVVVECRSETEQREVYELVAAQGYKCRLVSL